MNLDITLDLTNSGMNEEGKYILTMVASCDQQDFKEIISKLKEENKLEIKL